MRHVVAVAFLARIVDALAPGENPVPVDVLVAVQRPELLLVLSKPLRVSLLPGNVIRVLGDEPVAGFHEHPLDRERGRLPHRLQALLVERVTGNVFMFDTDVRRIVVGDVAPGDRADEILIAEYLVQQGAQMVEFVVVDGDEDNAVLPQHLAQQLHARQHHAAPLVVPGQVFAVDRLAEPLAHHRRVDVVVVGPALVAGVVGRIDVDALDLMLVDRQQRLERRQIVAVHDQVVVQAGRPAQPLVRRRPQIVERHGEMQILDERPALEAQRRHYRPLRVSCAR